MKKIYSYIVILFLTFSLTACGFHLRGYEPLPPQLKVLFIDSLHPYDPLIKDLQRVLRTSGVYVANGPHCAPITLQIISDSFAQSSTSVGTGGQVTTFVISYTVVFQLLDHTGQPILCPQTVVSTRTYAITSNLLLSNINAVSGLQDEMRRDLIYQILNRLRAPIVLQALSRV